MQPNPKIVIDGPEARQKALDGVDKVYVAVSATLGPRSSNVAIGRPFGRPAVVHDGVTVAKEVIPLEDKFEDIGAQIITEAADKTNGIGDGTTTATVLTQAIAKKAHTLITAGSRPMALREGIELATTAVIESLDTQAKPISEVDDVRRIATVSAQNEQIGEMVAKSYEKLGKEGIMSVEESKGTESYLEIKTGMEFDRGFRSPYFVNDTVLNEANVNNAHILVTDHKLRSVEQVGPMLERLVGDGVKDIVIIADEIDGEALAFIVVNHVKGNLRALAVQAPSFGDKRTDIMKDICSVTGATFISETAGMGLESVTKATLGNATRVVSTKDSTLIIDGQGAKEDIKTRAAEIKAQADNPDVGEFDKEKLMERYAKIQSGVAVLNIGAKSEPEIKEKKERAIDAISAAKAALEEGIVPGGGIALIEASIKARDLLKEDIKKSKSTDFEHGVNIVIDACKAPFNKLLSNAGIDPGTFINQVGAGVGVDVVSGELCTMVEKGIIDPVLVVKSAIGNASSAAVMLATTDVLIVEKPNEKLNNNL